MFSSLVLCVFVCLFLVVLVLVLSVRPRDARHARTLGPVLALQHPYSGKAKPKNVTVNFVSRKGVMQLSWGGKSGVPLETIFGVTKGIKTEVRMR